MLKIVSKWNACDKEHEMRTNLDKIKTHLCRRDEEIVSHAEKPVEAQRTFSQFVRVWR